MSFIFTRGEKLKCSAKEKKTVNQVTRVHIQLEEPEIKSPINNGSVVTHTNHVLIKLYMFYSYILGIPQRQSKMCMRSRFTTGLGNTGLHYHFQGKTAIKLHYNMFY